MNLMQLTLVLTIFIPMMVYSKPYSNEKLFGAFKELMLQSRTAAQETSSCNWITYEPDGTGNFYATGNYQCPTQTLVSGYCILGWSKAVTLCNSDSNCGGFSLTTNRNWHNGFDANNEASVTLVSVTAPIIPNPNNEWYSLSKKCYTFNT